MHRFFVEKRNIFPGKVLLEDSESIHKIRQVLRLNIGDKITLFDGEGGEYSGEIMTLQKAGIMVKIGSRLKNERTDKQYLTLGQALTRSTKIDNVVRMNTEAGVKEFVFFEADYGVVKLKDFNENKIERWRKITQEACRQSERADIPNINFSVSFGEVIGIEADLKIILHCRNIEGSADLKNLRKKIKSDSRILILVGPEGGFSKEELKKAKAKGFIFGFLNLPILRTETAGIVASSILLS
ncbi:16S rRNA (uracil(1498)-N(3))-methyltransferase [Candidatus Dojkabacteria bacterium]|nr:16S rRNA (uracil(1498)-N(3))-methyltransferase [Candidatus Dojkabacteria bacterium]